ncbi:GWxTD domain-containing protein [Terriglobus sp.]|uniref:GWxTD domain-containing protein n=1 Tax=Terriglobus sp. TaxID=1889013 RepID=UPI003B0072BB
MGIVSVQIHGQNGTSVSGAAQTPAAAQATPAATDPTGKVSKTEPQEEHPDPTKRRLTDRERIQQNKYLKSEIKADSSWNKWLNQDVVWIITDQEVAAFKSLKNDEEREQFVENFWLRRNPNPESPDNEFREQHYARIAYANEHFAAGKPGWRTDRGHVYIAYGKPDSIDSHPSGGNYQRPIDEGGGSTSTFPFEVWHYRYIEGIGDNLDLEFVDSCQCNDYHLTLDRSEKDALKHTPGAGLTLYEEMGMTDKKDRFNGSGLEQLGNGPYAASQQSKQFDRLSTYAKIMAPPPIKFKDLEQYISKSVILKGPPFYFDVRTDYVKVTNDTVLMPLTLQIRNRDVTFQTKDGVSTGTVNILGQVSNINHRIVQTFEDTVTVQVPSEFLAREQAQRNLYWKSVPLRPGIYKIDIVIKDVNNPDHIGTWRRSVNVPKYDDERLAASSLILASSMARVPTKEIGAGNFVIGNTKVVPSVSSSPMVPVIYKRNQNLNFWMQVYNLGIDDKSKQNNAEINYEVVDLASNKAVLQTSESTAKMNPNADQVTLEKSMPLASLQPGKYQVLIKVNDGISKQEISQSAPFTVE